MRTDFSNTIRSLADPVAKAESLQRSYEGRMVWWTSLKINPNMPRPLEPQRPNIKRICELLQIDPKDLTLEQYTTIQQIISR